jgi:hypothetical protein
LKHVDYTEKGTEDSDIIALPYPDWTNNVVEYNLEALGKDEDYDERKEKLNYLNHLVDEWYELASNPRTFANVNLPAATRVKRGHTGSCVDPEKIL